MTLEDVLRLPLAEILRLADAGERALGQPDQLLTIPEAAKRLSWSKDRLYRNSSRYPFIVRDGRLLRVSERALTEWIRKETESS